MPTATAYNTCVPIVADAGHAMKFQMTTGIRMMKIMTMTSIAKSLSKIVDVDTFLSPQFLNRKLKIYLMDILLWMIAILQMMVYIYIPCVYLFCIFRLLEREAIEDIIRNPFFKIKNVSLKTGFIVWLIQSCFLGVIISDFYFYRFHGLHPFFFDLLNL